MRSFPFGQSSLAQIAVKQFDLGRRGVLLTVRWLVLASLSVLIFYTQATETVHTSGTWPLMLLGFYGFSNVALMLLWKKEIASGLSNVVFLVDTAITTSILYACVGMDADLYVICFLIIYWSTMGKTVRHAVPMAAMGGIIYALLLMHQNDSVNWMDPKIMVRFPFFFVLAFFTTYLSEEAEKNRLRVTELEKTSDRLQTERDIAYNELDKKQAELIQAEKLSAMGHMAGALAHEIRNPLAVIIGYADDLKNQFPENSPGHKALASMDRCAKRCNRLVENLLRFSRQAKNEETFILQEAIQEAYELARLAQKAKALQVRVAYDFQDGLLLVGRRSELQQVLVNLTTNALDAMPTGGSLTFRTRQEVCPDGTWTVIQVEDTGTGIPENVREHIFDPFFTTKDPDKGTGLGLAIVRDILQSCNGLIQVNSQMGKGTTFILRFPATASAVATSTAAAA